MEKFRYDPRISADATRPHVRGEWQPNDMALLDRYISSIASDALSALQNPQAALNTWSGAFYGFRHYPEQTLFGNAGEHSLADFPEITDDMTTRGSEYHTWLLQKMHNPDDAIDLMERTTARTVLHTLEFLDRQNSRIDANQLAREFVALPHNYFHPTKWLSLLFNGFQIATIEVFMEETYFDSHQKIQLND